MTQCYKCGNWISYRDLRGKKHYRCKIIGYRSREEWKKGKCPGFKVRIGQLTLEEELEK